MWKTSGQNNKIVHYNVLDCVLGHWPAAHRRKKTCSNETRYVTVYFLSLWILVDGSQ